MNVLLDDKENVLMEHAGEAIIPIVSLDLLTAHHDVFLHKSLEELIVPLGGSVQTNTIRIMKEEHV